MDFLSDSLVDGHGLEESLPRARVRRVLRELKAEHRRRLRAHREQARVSVQVLVRDAVWSMDATHLGRDLAGSAVEGEVVRELSSTRTIGLSVGPPAKAQEAVEILEGVARERGGYPLVFLHDNGGAYSSEEVAKWCEDHEVLQLENLPRTPQHNAAAEHGMYGLELGADLGKGRVVVDTMDACARLAASRDRIDNYHPRRTRGWKTAVQVDQELPSWSSLVTRREFREKAACALEKGLIHCKGRRDERRAEREAILGTLQHFSVIQRTRGGQPWTAHIAESES